MHEQELEKLEAESEAGALLVGNENLGEDPAPKISKLHGGGATKVRSCGATEIRTC